MSATHLVVCPSCARHVRVREESCPFCRSVLSETLRETPEPLGPAVRLSRGALYAFGVGALAVATGCSSSSAAVMLPTIYGGPPGPPDLFQDGVEIGSDCSGKVYVDGQIGYAVCDMNAWAYTDEDPASDGYTPLDGGLLADSGTDADAGADHADAKADATVDATGATDAESDSDR